MRRAVLERFLQRQQGRHRGRTTGFDRVLFRGIVRSICYVEGLNYFLGNPRVPFKGFKAFGEKFSAGVRKRVEEIARRAGRPFHYLAASRTDQEKFVREVMERDRIEEGLVCVLACVEPCQSFRVRPNREKRELQLVARERKCLPLYFYMVNRDFGWMPIRLQTWLPLSIQVCVNGREWLARQMQRAGIEYEQPDHCFTSIADPERAQARMDRLGEYPWARWLNRWAQGVNPWLGSKARPQLRGYSWMVRESACATDGMFRSREALAEVYPALCRQAMEQFSAARVLRFLGRRTNTRFHGEVCTRLERRVEGICVKHCVEENSIKRYDKQGSGLRVETTVNQPQRFKLYRRVTRKGRRVKGWYPLRKGIVDLRRRLQLSRAANARYLPALAVVGEARPAHRILDPVSQPLKEPRPYRALRPISPEDSHWFTVLLHGEFHLQGVHNQDLRQPLMPEAESDPAQRRKAAARVTRQLRLLRAHGLIYREGRTYCYRPTPKGYALMGTALRFRQSDLALLAA